jgi:predicted metal-dependent enzyme (double-stranded beta helix superfamily)
LEEAWEMTIFQTVADVRVFSHLSAASQTSATEYLASARALLDELVRTPHLLAGVPLHRVMGGYGRTLLFGDGRISVWALVWAAGAKTVIHDHHCSCCFGMLQGSIREIWFQALDDRRAVVSGGKMRVQGDVACMMPNGANLHQMVNDETQEAISLHVYGFDHEAHASSIHREYERVDQ